MYLRIFILTCLITQTLLLSCTKEIIISPRKINVSHIKSNNYIIIDNLKVSLPKDEWGFTYVSSTAKSGELLLAFASPEWDIYGTIIPITKCDLMSYHTKRIKEIGVQPISTYTISPTTVASIIRFGTGVEYPIKIELLSKEEQDLRRIYEELKYGRAKPKPPPEAHYYPMHLAVSHIKANNKCYELLIVITVPLTTKLKKTALSLISSITTSKSSHNIISKMDVSIPIPHEFTFYDNLHNKLISGEFEDGLIMYTYILEQFKGVPEATLTSDYFFKTLTSKSREINRYISQFVYLPEEEIESTLSATSELTSTETPSGTSVLPEATKSGVSLPFVSSTTAKTGELKPETTSSITGVEGTSSKPMAKSKNRKASFTLKEYEKLIDLGILGKGIMIYAQNLKDAWDNIVHMWIFLTYKNNSWLETITMFDTDLVKTEDAISMLNNAFSSNLSITPTELLPSPTIEATSSVSKEAKQTLKPSSKPLKVAPKTIKK